MENNMIWEVIQGIKNGELTWSEAKQKLSPESYDRLILATSHSEPLFGDIW